MSERKFAASFFPKAKEWPPGISLVPLVPSEALRRAPEELWNGCGAHKTCAHSCNPDGHGIQQWNLA